MTLAVLFAVPATPALAGAGQHAAITIANDTFTGGTGVEVASGGNGFYNNACTGVANQPFSPVEAAMGKGNTFTNLCYSTTNIAALPPSICKS